MGHSIRYLVISSLLLFVFIGFSFCQEADITQLIDTYCKDTDLQKSAIRQEYADRKIAVTGTVSDVKDENTFDVVNDVERHYYKVITDVENTAAGNSYRAVLIYKDAGKVKDIAKGQVVSFRGNMIRIVDEGLYISVWLTADEMTAQEMELFK